MNGHSTLLVPVIALTLSAVFGLGLPNDIGSAKAATLTHHWQLTETSGATAVDSVGGLHGTLENFGEPNSAWQNPGLNFDRIKECCGGSNPHISLPLEGALTKAGGFSITAWVTTEDLTGDSQWVFAQQTPGAGAADRSKWELAFNIGNDLVLRGGKQCCLGTGSTEIPAGQNFVAFTWNPTDINNGDQKGYLNGVEDFSSNHPYSSNFDNQQNAIGANTDGNFGFDGVIQDVRTYDGALTGSEILELFTLGPGGTQIIPGDFNGDHVVDTVDFGILRDNLSGHLDGPVSISDGDIDFDRDVDLRDFRQFKALFPGVVAEAIGVPEPSTAILALWAPAGIALLRRRSQPVR